jgi:hypothetical protein
MSKEYRQNINCLATSIMLDSLVRQNSIWIGSLSVVLLILVSASSISFNSFAYSYNLFTINSANQLQDINSLYDPDPKIKLVDDDNNTFSDLSRNLTASDNNNNNNNNPSNETNSP